MNGTKPNFINGNVKKEYYEKPNPYANPVSCHVNLLELSRYAKKAGKKLVELTKEEVEKFAI
ncbi:MAG: hypothetical protein KH828_09465 [Clostridiales bacterium]|nr:hypothetical protein [Clostridiales bacterium]